ncbi:hypothetical protein AGABI2DRAFT_117561 [Agaricus bisporus var. bisporus H97]|uniref:hypothetical protein n=1 Tax=Agaricus bisporus var. bisporus (strain H97 / ATCC MYA-4626 / FGSC 10389) TaxID=936046 RepID=UPI00029F7255|nr:hypothetical protein AGABI2DRAFT_117561 [Agaricus bisporus var. bisporus H97]EKV48761.1 hypothetical protein AGABI2DRAFT_117561 [Agaricus bisporus var. bisporus H97]
MLPIYDGARNFLNLDIWSEIIKEFRWSFGDDQSTRQTKRATLRTISLVSRQLAPLSQSELCRTVSSVKHVTRLIVNAEGSNVVDDMPVKPLAAKCKAQVLRILSYTRTFIYRSSKDDEDLDWEFLILATGCSPLFCNLDTIIVDFVTDPSTHSGRNILSMVASSSVKRVIYYCLTPKDEKFALLLQNNLRMHNAPITSVEVFKGYHISPGIASRLLYTSAPGISLNIHSLHLHPSAQGNFAPWYLALSNPPNLVHLRIVVRTPINNGPPPYPPQIEDEKIQFTKLERLEINASGQHDDLLSYLNCPSLVTFALYLDSAHGFPTILNSVARFRRIEGLSIAMYGKYRPKLRLKYLLPVINSLVLLKDLTIRGVNSRLAEGDVVEILTTRTSLRTLIISGPKSISLPLSALFSIAEPLSCQLEMLCLPFDFSEISSLRIPPVWPEITTLKRFAVWDGDCLPDLGMREKLKLAEFVHRIFPHAGIGRLTDNPKTVDWKSIEDLEELRRYISCNIHHTTMFHSSSEQKSTRFIYEYSM